MLVMQYEDDEHRAAAPYRVTLRVCERTRTGAPREQEGST